MTKIFGWFSYVIKYLKIPVNHKNLFPSYVYFNTFAGYYAFFISFWRKALFFISVLVYGIISDRMGERPKCAWIYFYDGLFSPYIDCISTKYFWEILYLQRESLYSPG